MAKPTHRPDASEKIDEYISSLPDWSRKICQQLRQIALKSDPQLVEDWKWGPNYYLDGMVFGFAAFKKHVAFVFFKGSQLKDKKKLLEQDSSALNIRSFKFVDTKEIKENILLEYIFEAIDNNKKGLKVFKTSDKTVVIPPAIKKEFKKAGVLDFFETCSYSHKFEYVRYIEAAKKAETKTRRIEKAIAMLKKKRSDKAAKEISKPKKKT